jgi:hypothetical protein
MYVRLLGDLGRVAARRHSGVSRRIEPWFWSKYQYTRVPKKQMSKPSSTLEDGFLPIDVHQIHRLRKYVGPRPVTTYSRSRCGTLRFSRVKRRGPRLKSEGLFMLKILRTRRVKAAALLESPGRSIPSGSWVDALVPTSCENTEVLVMMYGRTSVRVLVGSEEIGAYRHSGSFTRRAGPPALWREGRLT